MTTVNSTLASGVVVPCVGQYNDLQVHVASRPTKTNMDTNFVYKSCTSRHWNEILAVVTTCSCSRCQALQHTNARALLDKLLVAHIAMKLPACYGSHVSALLLPVLSQISPLRTLTPYFILHIGLRLEFWSDPFPSNFPSKILCAFLISPCAPSTNTFHPSWFNYPAKFGKEHKL
jgi:hypothetical protein